ncbi:hypothetical protein EUTSA_v10005282mg, partial [Eutrema salsugineum]
PFLNSFHLPPSFIFFQHNRPTKKASVSIRDKETSQSKSRTMAITQALVLFASALLLSMLFNGVDSTRSNETRHEHAVENPDEVAAMVDM